jgi:hypothetical protein
VRALIASPKILEPIGRHFGVPDRVLDVLVPEVVLQSPRVVAQSARGIWLVSSLALGAMERPPTFRLICHRHWASAVSAHTVRSTGHLISVARSQSNLDDPYRPLAASLHLFARLSRTFLAVWAALLNHGFYPDRAALRAERRAERLACPTLCFRRPASWDLHCLTRLAAIGMQKPSIINEL